MLTPVAQVDGHALSARYERLAEAACPIAEWPWRYNPAAAGRGPELGSQGWKLHVSATVLTACEVFERARDVLAPVGVAYKAAASLGALAMMNTGVPQFSQTGKFITVYCESADQALGLARDLDQATVGLAGPAVPFDLPLRRGGLVYYRFGAFRSRTLRDPRGRWRADQRGEGFAVPDWIDNPFPNVDPPEDADGPIGLRFLVLRALTQRGKGGVYEALDLGAEPARLCILKEGRPDGETQWDGTDGHWRVGHEGEVLGDLRRNGVPAPEVFCVFEQGENRYLALEKIEGSPLVEPRARRTRRRGWAATRAISGQLAALLEQIHRAGWAWRDCKPDNLLEANGQIRPIDFEGACRIEETQVGPWGSFAYTPRSIADHLVRPPGWQEDDFAAAVLAVQLGTGRIPQPARNDWSGWLAKARCPSADRERLLARLETSPVN